MCFLSLGLILENLSDFSIDSPLAPKIAASLFAQLLLQDHIPWLMFAERTACIVVAFCLYVLGLILNDVGISFDSTAIHVAFAVFSFCIGHAG
jgi:hypothetical protein